MPRRSIEFASQFALDEARKEVDACRDLQRDIELLRAKAKVLGADLPDLNLRFVDDALIDLVSDIGGAISERERRFEREGMAA